MLHSTLCCKGRARCGVGRGAQGGPSHAHLERRRWTRAPKTPRHACQGQCGAAGSSSSGTVFACWDVGAPAPSGSTASKDAPCWQPRCSSRNPHDDCAHFAPRRGAAARRHRRDGLVHHTHAGACASAALRRVGALRRVSLMHRHTHADVGGRDARTEHRRPGGRDHGGRRGHRGPPRRQHPRVRFRVGISVPVGICVGREPCGPGRPHSALHGCGTLALHHDLLRPRMCAARHSHPRPARSSHLQTSCEQSTTSSSSRQAKSSQRSA